MKRILEYASVILLCVATVFLIGLQLKTVGWTFLFITAVAVAFTSGQFRKYLLLVCLSIAILGITPITTDISYLHFVQMGVALGLAVGLPFFFSQYIFKDKFIAYKFHHGRDWYKSEIFYILLTVVIAYFLIPFYLKDTGAYLNWTVEPGFSNILRFFIGTNALGIWDELFFVNTVLGTLRRFFAFPLANLFQSILFTSFLYELGFTGWGYIVIFLFALIQGYMFKKPSHLFMS